MISMNINKQNKSGGKGLVVDCTFESNCPLVGPGTVGGVPSVRVFLRDPITYLREFQRKPWKTPNG